MIDGAAVAPLTRPENLQRLPSKPGLGGETDAAGNCARNLYTPIRPSLVGRVRNRTG